MKKEMDVLLPIECKEEAAAVADIFEKIENENQGGMLTAFLSGYKLGQLSQNQKEVQTA